MVQPFARGHRAVGSRCVEGSMAFVSNGRRVVPHLGDTGKNGAQDANAKRAEVPAYIAGRRAAARVAKDGESLGPGGPAALALYLGRPPTLPRRRDPGPAGNPGRAVRLVSLVPRPESFV